MSRKNEALEAKRQTPCAVLSSSPRRVHFITRFIEGEDGKRTPLWGSRPWNPGERTAYCRDVLNRDLYKTESKDF